MSRCPSFVVRLAGLLLALGVCLSPSAGADASIQPLSLQVQPLTPIPSLDLSRYLGEWYEIAKYPNRFQKDCLGFTQARYSAMPDGRVQVVNECANAKGGMDRAIGTAKRVSEGDSPRLKVRFAPAILSFIPFVWGDYWVIDLDPDYRLAAVSEPSREYLWILSREPTVDAVRYDALLQRLAGQGFDLDKLVPTRQQVPQ